MLTAIERARRYVAKCPPGVSGQGGHNATFHVACVLVHGFALGEGDAMIVLREWNRTCVPPWSEGELVHKVKSAASAPQRMQRGWLLGDNADVGTGSSKLIAWLPPRKPEFKADVLKRIARKTSGIVDVFGFISERSPVTVETQDSASVLRRLYRRGSGEKVLVFTDMESQGQFLWLADKSDVIQKRHLPAGKEGVWFLPQPVTGEFYPNPRQNEKLSRRSQEAVTSWRYAVLESDKADADDWLRKTSLIMVMRCP